MEAVTPDTIFMDLKKIPAAMKAFEPMIAKMQETFGGGSASADADGAGAEAQPDEGAGAQPDEGAKSAGSEAISDNMLEAMIQYMPLRGMLSFGDGELSYDDLVEMIRKIKL